MKEEDEYLKIEISPGHYIYRKSWEAYKDDIYRYSNSKEYKERGMEIWFGKDWKNQFKIGN